MPDSGAPSAPPQEPATAAPPGAPVAAPRGVELYQMCRPRPDVQAEARRLGFQPVPQLTKVRLVKDRSAFDAEHYSRRIWEPGEVRSAPPEFGGEEKFGIPPGWTGLVCLDLESPVWDPIRQPTSHTDRQIAAAEATFLQVAEATRRLRPGARIMFHNMMRGATHPRAREAEEKIALASDAVSPSFYVSRARLDRELAVNVRVLTRCLEFKKRHGRKVYPVVWKRFRDKSRDVMPAADFRRVVEAALLTDLDGVRADGICLWGNDGLFPETRAGADDTDLAAMRIIVEVTRKRQELETGRTGEGAAGGAGRAP